MNNTRSLPEWIQQRMDELGIENRLDLNHRLGKKGRGTVHNVLDGSQLIPVRDIERWSNALLLNEQQHQEFAVLVNLSHDSPDFQRRYWAQEDELAELRARVARLRGLVLQVAEKARSQGLDIGDLAAELG